MSSETWITQIENLPVLPQVAMRVTERMQSPTATVTEISNLIKSDIGLSTKVLRLANSSYYSIPGGVNDVPKALQYLGFTTIAQIVLTSSVIGAFKAQGFKELPLNQFWLHCFAVGQLAEIAARSLQMKSPSDAFIGGLMHDLGKLILLELQPEQLLKTVRFAEEHKVSFIAAENSLGLKTHVDLGVLLAQHWKLPNPLISAIEFHHGGSSDPSHQLIEWADLWVNARKIGVSGNHAENENECFNQLSSDLKLAGPSLQQIENQFHKEFEKAGAILSGS